VASIPDEKMAEQCQAAYLLGRTVGFLYEKGATELAEELHMFAAKLMTAWVEEEK